MPSQHEGCSDVSYTVSHLGSPSAACNCMAGSTGYLCKHHAGVLRLLEVLEAEVMQAYGEEAVNRDTEFIRLYW